MAENVMLRLVEFSHRKLCSVLVPTICIYWALGLQDLPFPSLYQESFGNSDHFLSLSYDTPPHQSGRHVFSGVLAGSEGEVAITGYSERLSTGTEYRFESASGHKYVANLVPRSNPCEHQLRLRSLSGAREEESLRAAFCVN